MTTEKSTTNGDNVAKNMKNKSGGKAAAIVVLSVLVLTIAAIVLIWINVGAYIMHRDTETVQTTKDAHRDKAAPRDVPTTVVNKEGDYSFETSLLYLVDTFGDKTTVYTGANKIVPYYSIDKMNNYRHSTPSDFLNGMISSAKTRYQNRLTGQPQKITVDVNNEDIPGIKYAYSTVDGSKTIHVEQFIMQVPDDDDFYVWTCDDYKDDGDTYLEMLASMATLKEIDD